MNALLNHVWGKSPAQDRVWAQVTGLAPNVAVRRLLMAVSFQCFIDDSRSKDEFVLAGHIATPEMWAQFSKAWDELLPFGTRAKNGKLHFKMSEMAMNPERMARVPAFYKVLEDHVLLSMSARMNLEDYERALERAEATTHGLASSNPRVKLIVSPGAPSKPFRILYRGLMDTFHKNRGTFADRLPLDQKVDFIFDNQSEKTAVINEWNDYIGARDDEIRGLYGAAPRFEDDQEFLPLQAADLWAWWVREWYEEDAYVVPDKLRDFDFGKWRGKKRPQIVMSATEDQIVDGLVQFALATAVEVDEALQKDPIWPS